MLLLSAKLNWRLIHFQIFINILCSSPLHSLYITFEATIYLHKYAASQPVNMCRLIYYLVCCSVCVSQPIEPGPCAGWAGHHLECVIIITLIIASLSSSLSSSRRGPAHTTPATPIQYDDPVHSTPSYLNYLNYPPIIPNYRRGKKPNSFESQIFCWRC